SVGMAAGPSSSACMPARSSRFPGYNSHHSSRVRVSSAHANSSNASPSRRHIAAPSINAAQTASRGSISKRSYAEEVSRETLALFARWHQANEAKSATFEDGVDNPAAAGVFARLAAVCENVGVGAAGLFQRVGQHGHLGEGVVVVDGAGNAFDLVCSLEAADPQRISVEEV